MNKRMIAKKLGLMAVLMAGAVSLSACGKKDARAQYYEEELGLSPDEAKELSDMVGEFENYGGDYEDDSNAQAFTFVQYDAMPEIKNSSINDCYVQVNDILLKDDGSMTLGEVMDAFAKSAESEHYGYIGMNRTPFTGDELVEANSTYGKVTLYYMLKENEYSMDMDICEIIYSNPTDQMMDVKDCVVVNICAGDGDDVEAPFALNVYYAGNINAGVQLGRLTDSEYYSKVADMQINYDNYEQYLAEQGYDWDSLDDNDSSGGKELKTGLIETRLAGHYKETNYFLGIDTSTRNIRMVRRADQGEASQIYTTRITSMSQTSEDQWNVYYEECKAAIMEKYDVESLEIVGTVLEDPYMDVVFLGSNGKYYVDEVSSSFINYDGSIHTPRHSRNDEFDTLEECISKYNLDNDNISESTLPN